MDLLKSNFFVKKLQFLGMLVYFLISNKNKTVKNFFDLKSLSWVISKVAGRFRFLRFITSGRINGSMTKVFKWSLKLLEDMFG